LTDEMERQADAYFDQIESYGGVIEAIESGFFQKEIAEASYRYQRSIESKDRIIIGVNHFQRDEDRQEMDLLKITEEVAQGQARSLNELRTSRDNSRVQRSLERLQQACRDERDNVMPHLIECVNAYCTEGEIVEAMAAVYGRYTERSVF
jgi:methylmalonyl-CoA mutase, N-terminal domain